MTLTARCACFAKRQRVPPHVDSGHVILHSTSDSEVCLFCQKVEDSVFSPFSPILPLFSLSFPHFFPVFFHFSYRKLIVVARYSPSCSLWRELLCCCKQAATITFRFCFGLFSYLKLIVVAQVLTQLLLVEGAVMLTQEGCNGFRGSFHRT